MYTYNTLTVTGYEGKPVPNTFIRQRGATSHAAIILPGLGYTAQMPLLFYTGNHLIAQNADVLQVNYNYLTAFRGIDRAAQHRWLFADAEAAYRALLQQRAYDRVTVVGKSLGTLAMAHFITTQTFPTQVDALWLTPVLTSPDVRAQIATFDGPSLLVIGTADQFYDADVLTSIGETPSDETPSDETSSRTFAIIDGADHGINITRDGNIDVIQSIHALETAIRAIVAFLDTEK